MFPLMRAGLVRVLAADPKLMELAYGRVIFDTYGALRRRPRTPSPSCSTRPSPTCRPGRPGSPGVQRDHTPTRSTRSRWCWSMRSRS